MSKSDQERRIDELREAIDAVDKRLVESLAERAKLVQQVGEAKREGGIAVYAPHRERAVIDRAVSRNPGPLSDRTIEAIFREIMSGSFRLELPLRVGYLGPPGTFSHLAALRHFGASVEFAPLATIDAVLGEVESGRLDYGLAPYENSIGGSIVDTLEALQTRQVRACAEALIDVSQTLMANCAPEAVKRICSKPEVFLQCRQWLARRYPGVPLVGMESTAAAVQRAAGEEGTAAIGCLLAGEINGVRPLFERIQDRSENITRFLVLGRQGAKRSGSDKTVVQFTTHHKPGALVEVLDCFRKAGVNLSHIDKRPSGRENWQYTFFVDIEGHEEDAAVRTALGEARAHCASIASLGSYPRAQRIL